MQVQKLIQIFDDPPETHYFLYKGKKFPFNFDLFKISSKYFSSNQDLQYTQIINLVDETSENCSNFPEESIQSFINYSQRQQILLTNENAVPLNYLAKKYEVNLLIQATENYIEEYQNDVALQILLTYQNDQSFNTETFENIISRNFESYINEDQFLSLNFPIVYRIFGKFYQKRDKTSKLTDEITGFLFKCLTKYGKEASSLFSLIDTCDLTSEKVDILLTKFSDVFDFHFINSSILKTIYDIQNESLKREEVNKIEQEKLRVKYEGEIKILKDEIQIIKKDQIVQLDAQKKREEENKIEQEKFREKYEGEIKILKDEIQKMKKDKKVQLDAQKKREEENLKEIQSQFEKFKEELKEIKETQAQKLNDEITEIKNQLAQKENEIQQIKKILIFNLSDIKSFNTSNAEEQQIIINIMKSSYNNEKIAKIEQIVNFLSNLNNHLNCIFILSDSNKILDCDFTRIGICNQMTEILFDSGKLRSPEFLKNIDNFSEFFFEIKYPSQKYQNIYQQILDVKQSHKDRIKISIFITGIEKTDRYFRNNKEINHIKLDSSIKEIESSENKEGSFEGCSSLENIIIPSSVKLIGSNSFKNCSSLKSIEIPSLEKKISYNDFEGCNSLTKIITSSSTSIPTLNIDDYEIEQLIDDSYNIVFKGFNKKTGKKVAIKTLNDDDLTHRVKFIFGSNTSQIDLPGITKIQSFRFPLTNEEKTKFKLLEYETVWKGNTEKIDLTGYISVYDYMENGNIFDITQKYLKSEGKLNNKMNPTIRSKIIFGVAATMKHLHNKNIIHRNLTNVNILLDDNFEPKIGSFSFAQSLNNLFELEIGVGTPLYIAPEMASSKVYDFPVDVYAYSIILYRLFSLTFSLNKPKNFSTAQEYLNEIISGNRPKKPDNIPDHYWDLIEKCWQQDPSKRPTFDEITQILKDDKYALEEFGMKTDLEQLHEYQIRINKI